MVTTAEEVEILIRESSGRMEGYLRGIREMIAQASEALVYYYLLRGGGDHRGIWEAVEDSFYFNGPSRKEWIGYGEYSSGV